MDSDCKESGTAFSQGVKTHFELAWERWNSEPVLCGLGKDGSPQALRSKQTLCVRSQRRGSKVIHACEAEARGAGICGQSWLNSETLSQQQERGEDVAGSRNVVQ